MTSIIYSSLNQRDHRGITEHLASLNNQELIKVGLRLGLHYSSLQKISPESLLNDMVNAWLRRDDDVTEVGEPTWESLRAALEDCGHKGIASEIKKSVEGSFWLVKHGGLYTNTSLENNVDKMNEHGSYHGAITKREVEEMLQIYFYNLPDLDNLLCHSRSAPLNRATTLLMDEHKSYHAAITGREAEGRLKRYFRNSHNGHGYLTRFSESRQCYVLSIYQKIPNNVTRHFKIVFENGVYQIEGKDERFDGLAEMLTHYENNRIDPALSNIGQCFSEQEYKQEKQEEEQMKRESEALQQRQHKEQKHATNCCIIL